MTAACQPFAKALRIEVTKMPEQAAAAHIAATVDAAMATGDVLAFWMRSGMSGEATLDARFRATAGAVQPGGRGPGGGRGMFMAQPLNPTYAPERERA
jgi:hypothetical protein